MELLVSGNIWGNDRQIHWRVNGKCGHRPSMCSLFQEPWPVTTRGTAYLQKDFKVLEELSEHREVGIIMNSLEESS